MSIYNHFRKEELPFVERALEMLKLVERKQTMRLTDFMDPRQFFIFQSLCSQVADVEVRANGGYTGAERVRVLLYPAYVQPTEEDFQLSLLEIKGDQRFVQLEHRDVMGSLLNVGLKREKFGDILMSEHGCQTVVASEVVDFIRMQVTQIHRIPVVLEEVPLSSAIVPRQNLLTKVITVPSLRVDAVIGEVYNLSRAKALVPIRAGKLKVNWKVIDDPSQQISEGDLLSLAGFGRVHILEVAGTTRSGRIRLTAGVYT